jgi:ABC-type glycerol-3-phosphate transport system permease component
VELEHAALIDGANRAQALWYVVAPLALPGIIATAIFTFIVAWNDFLFALVLIGKDELKTLAIGINDFFHMVVVESVGNSSTLRRRAPARGPRPR